MKQNKREYNPKAFLTFRVLAGLYLLYISFSLIKEFKYLGEKEKPFNILFILIFIAVALFIMINSTLTWMKFNKAESAGQDTGTEENGTKGDDTAAKEEIAEGKEDNQDTEDESAE